MKNKMELLCVGQIHPDPDWQMANQSHPVHELIVVLDGAMEVEGGGGAFRATAGTTLLYPAGVRHSERSDPVGPVRSIYCIFRAPLYSGHDIVTVFDGSGRMRQMARWLYDDRDASGEAAQAASRALFHALWHEFFRGDRAHEPALRSRLRRLVRRDIAAPVSVTALAKEAGLSRWHYMRTYKRLTGRTPMADVREERLDYARDCLLASNIPLKLIAQRAGLGSAQAFSRAFAARFGQPPAAYRHRYQVCGEYSNYEHHENSC